MLRNGTHIKQESQELVKYSLTLMFGICKPELRHCHILNFSICLLSSVSFPYTHVRVRTCTHTHTHTLTFYAEFHEILILWTLARVNFIHRCWSCRNLRELPFKLWALVLRIPTSYKKEG